MKASATPYSTDWLAVSIRWIFLLAWIATRPAASLLSVENWPVVAFLAWNLVMTVMAGTNLRLLFHRQINVAVDVLLVGLLYWMHGGLSGSSFWVGLLPILTAAVYFEVLGALVVAGLFSALVFVTQWILSGAQLAAAITWAAGVLLAGGVLGSAVALLVRSFRARRHSWLAADEARHRSENQRLRAIYDLTSTLTTTLSFRRVLDAALDLSYSALNPDKAGSPAEPLVGAILIFRGGRLQVGASRHFTAADARAVFSASDGILKRVFDEGESIYSMGGRKGP